MFGKLPRNSLIKNPAGTWSFVGSVDAALAHTTKDGDVPTEKQIKDARLFGPGVVGLRTRAWPTREAALAAKEEIETTNAEDGTMTLWCEECGLAWKTKLGKGDRLEHLDCPHCAGRHLAGRLRRVSWAWLHEHGLTPMQLDGYTDLFYRADLEASGRQAPALGN